MNHGTAKIKKELVDLEGNIVVQIGEVGVITAYLPDDETFAVLFSENRWYTFRESEKTFLERFDVNNNEKITNL